MRRAAMELLHRLDPKPYVDTFLRALADDDHVVRLHAVEGLSTLRATGAVPELIDLAVADAEVRFEIVSALGEIGGAQAAEFLEQQLLSHEWAMARCAAESLAGLGSEWPAGDAIAAALNTRGAAWRGAFAPALARCAERRHVELLESMMTEPDPNIRFHVASALRRLRVTTGEEIARMATGDFVPLDVYWTGFDVSECEWTEVAERELLEVLAGTRLVFLAEAHGLPGVLAKQEEIVRALTARWSGPRTLGFEPPAQRFQQPVLDVAWSRGWELLALEASAEARPMLARDRDAIARMRAFFRRDDSRMVVLYGMAHVLGSGRFHEAMADLERVTVVLECRELYWRIVRRTGELDLSDKAYRIGPDLYYCPAQPPLCGLGDDPHAPADFVIDRELLRQVTTGPGK